MTGRPLVRWVTRHAGSVAAGVACAPLLAASLAVALPQRVAAQQSSRAQATADAKRAPATKSAPRRLPSAEPRRRTVIVDAGHGGPDRGMTGTTSSSRRIYEKDISLAVARQLARRLEAGGVNVIMTRTSDTLIALDDRGRIANRENGDLFISVHVNAANPKWNRPGSARGFETYFLAEAKTEDERRVADMENEASRYDDAGERPADAGLGFMFTDMLQNQHLRESSALAATIQAGLKGAHPGPSRGVKQAGFRVLVTAYMPAVLVEIGFGTNPADADWMSSAAGQAQAADAIAAAALEYLAQYERRVSGGNRGARQ